MLCPTFTLTMPAYNRITYFHQCSLASLFPSTSKGLASETTCMPNVIFSGVGRRLYQEGVAQILCIRLHIISHPRPYYEFCIRHWHGLQYIMI